MQHDEAGVIDWHGEFLIHAGNVRLKHVLPLALLPARPLLRRRQNLIQWEARSNKAVRAMAQPTSRSRQRTRKQILPGHRRCIMTVVKRKPQEATIFTWLGF